MAGSGASTVSRAHEGDPFYNPLAVRRQRYHHQHQQWLHQQHLQQQPPLQRLQKYEFKANVDESTLLNSSVCSSSPPPKSTLTTNLDRLMESVTPHVPTQYMPVTTTRGWEPEEAELRPFFSLGDLWESFEEWSVYGVGVPLLLNGKDSVKQYYVPFLSGIQLYIDPPSKLSSRLRQPWESEVDKQQTLNSQRLSSPSLNLGDKPSTSSSKLETLATNSTSSSLVFEFLEQDQPHHRKPFIDKVSVLASQFPQLGLYASSDLLPSSWFSVAWYPIYRIPMGPTLQNLDASFLTFHSLSTHPKSTGLRRDRKQYESRICLPVFGLASYKLKGSVLSPTGRRETEQEHSLLLAADQWLRYLHVDLPDYSFFVSHGLHSR